MIPFALPNTPLDFLGRVIVVGNWIVYPTGGTSARMVLAKVKRIETPWDGPDSGYCARPHDGLRGHARFRLVVNREKEGTRTSHSLRWAVDSGREVRVDQLHRVVVVPEPSK